jgi:hypothetical protein
MRIRLNKTLALSLMAWLTALASLPLLVAACSSGSDETATPTPVPAEDALQNAHAAMAEVDQFQFELTHPEGRTSLGNGMQLSRAEGAVVAPDKLSVKADVEIRPIFLTLEARVIGDQTWITNPLAANTWAEAPAGESPLNFLDPAQLVSDVLGQLDGVRYPSTGPASSGPIILEGTVEAEALSSLVGSVEAGSILNVRLSLERETYRLTEALITGRLQTQDEPDTARLIKLSGFDSTITIEPPL